MASKKVSINDATYTKLDTGSGTAIDVQNVSSVTVLIRFAASAPTIGDGGYNLDPGDSVVRNGHTGDMFGICEGAPTADVEVGE